MSALMTLHDVAYPGRLEPLIADVEEGVWLHLVGPNGSGKSTLLAMMAGLLDGSGRITFAGRLLTNWSGESLARQRALLSQHHVPPFAMPVWHYLSLHQQDARDANGMMQIAERFQLMDKLPRLVNQLSGGEWQRVRLAAVILQIHPDASPCSKMLLLDEPMNSLDVAQQATLNNVLRELCNAGVTVIMSSHDLNHTLHYAQCVWLLHRGKLVSKGDCNDVLMPKRLEEIWQVPFREINVDGERFLYSR